MKPTTHHHYFLIPCALEDDLWRKQLRAILPFITPEEVLGCYFSNLAFMMEQGWVLGRDDGMVEIERFRQAVHMLNTLMVSDIEGMTPVPQELDLAEVDLIHELVKKITWDLWTHLHSDCWPNCQLKFIRVLSDAFVVGYHGEHPFQTRERNPFLPALLSEI